MREDRGVGEIRVMAGRRTYGIVISRLVLGLVVLWLGVVFLLDEFGIVDAHTILRFFMPVALLTYGLMRLMGLWCRQQTTMGAIFTFIGGWMLLRALNILPFGIRDFWPVLIIGIGIALVMGGLGRARGGINGGGRSGDPGNTINAFAFWSGVDRKVTSTNFQGGDITAFMGGHEIDLRPAKMEGGTATIDLLVMMGGVDMRIPEDWALSCEAVPIMGGIEDRTRPPAGEIKGRLILRGFIMMGGVEVKN